LYYVSIFYYSVTQMRLTFVNKILLTYLSVHIYEAQPLHRWTWLKHENNYNNLARTKFLLEAWGTNQLTLMISLTNQLYNLCQDNTVC